MQGTCSLQQYFGHMLSKKFIFYGLRIPCFVFNCYMAIVTPYISYGQEMVIEGMVWEHQSRKPISAANLEVEGTSQKTTSGIDGSFKIIAPMDGGDLVLLITAKDFMPKRLPLEKNNENGHLNLGIIYLERDISAEKGAQLVTLTENELADSEDVESSTGLLQATRDIYLQRAAFDFSLAFFRVRGYDSSNANVFLNGISMNKFANGRAQWNNWGGLNDVTRNQEFNLGLQVANNAFASLLGTTNINTRPSSLRPGLRLTNSFSNRTYASRLMATFSSGLFKNSWSYSLSASRRWAKNGFINGTLYNAYSVFGSLEFLYNTKNSFHFTTLLAKNRRGQSAAITEEVKELAGRRYNPYWGIQNGKIRNSRERIVREPIVMLNHYYTSENFKFNTGIAYQFGIETKSRIGYYNAPNPDPTYYRYLPSFYLNSAIGANYVNAAIARKAFLNQPQLSWADLYFTNNSTQLNGRAAYILFNNVMEGSTFSLNSTGKLALNKSLELNIGVAYKKTNSNYYSRIGDLLGAQFHIDNDAFSNTRNDINGALEKRTGDIFNYNYIIRANRLNGFLQFIKSKTNWKAHISASYSSTSYLREGLFQNERYPNSSFGEGKTLQFSNFGIKGGFTYRISGRHWATTHVLLQSRAPFYQNVYVNPRENNLTVPNIKNEKITSADLNYFVRLASLTGRLTGYYTRFQHGSDVNFFFVDSGLGSDFVQEVITDLDKLHLGIELGLKQKVSSAVSLSMAASLGKYLFASDPNVHIYFDPIDSEINHQINVGHADLGISKLKDLKLAQGPQKAFSLGIDYRDPEYWWLGTTINYLSNNYPNTASLSRTQSFYLNPENGQPFQEATPENVAEILKQRELDDIYFLNITAGKSWRSNGKYISVFANVNNVLDAAFRSGGYQQGRNGNYAQLAKDNLSGTPSFAPKYWYGFGRTFFLNLTISF